MDIKGAGVINHIWITISPDGATASRNDIILRMYWDGNSYPSVESPLGHSLGTDGMRHMIFFHFPLSVTPGSGNPSLLL